jgi:hypothetical protein
VVYQHDADDSYVTLIGRGVIIAEISATTRAVVSAAIGALPGLRWSWE